MIKIKRIIAILMAFIFISTYIPGNLIYAGTVSLAVANTENRSIATPTGIDEGIFYANNLQNEGAVPQLIVKYKSAEDSKKTLENVENQIKELKEKEQNDSATPSSMYMSGIHSRSKMVAEVNIETVETINGASIDMLAVENEADLGQVMETLENDANVEYVQLNYTFEPLSLPVDSGFNNQWALKEPAGTGINMDSVWFGRSSFEPVTVGILDTGIDVNHEDLDGSVVDGWDFINNTQMVFSENESYHGTQIAGIITARQNEIGIAGIAGNARIMPLKFIENGQGYTSDAIRAIEYAKKSGVKIINCSWGSEIYNPALEDIMRQNSDILFVCAAGNTGSEKQVYPAAFNLPNVISVASSNVEGEISNWSSRGMSTAIAAPGEYIYTLAKGNQYEYINGTSASAAFVTGAAALYWGKNTELTATDIYAAIVQTGAKTDKFSGQVASGAMLDVSALIDSTGVYELPPFYSFFETWSAEVMQILETYSKYSELSDEQKNILFEQIGVRPDTMEICEVNGFGLRDSIYKARMMQQLNASIDYILEIIKAYGSEETAAREINYFAFLQNEYAVISKSEVDKMIPFIEKGFGVRRIIGVYVVSGALGIGMSELITKDDSGVEGADLSALSTEEAEALKDIAKLYCVDINILLAYLAANSLTVNGMNEKLMEWQQKIGLFINSIVNPYDAASTNITAQINANFPATPFKYRNDSNESINLNTGGLTYEQSIVSIPGVNGLNLDLKLRYNSNNATVDKLGAAQYDPRTGTQGVNTYAAYGSAQKITYNNDFNLPSLEKEPYYGSASYVSIYDAYREKARFDGIYNSINVYNDKTVYSFSNYGVGMREPWAPNFNINTVEIDYTNRARYAGIGWELNLPSIKTSSPKFTDRYGKYVVLADGSTVSIEEIWTDSVLYGFAPLGPHDQLIDIALDKEKVIQNSYYVITYKDFKKEYFSEFGGLIARQDKYGNTIKFDYVNNFGGEYPSGINITDTTGAVTTIQMNYNKMIFTTPDGNSVTCNIGKHGIYDYLDNIVDKEGKVTSFSYFSDTARFDYFTTDFKYANAARYHNLTTVTYPSGMKTKYSYGKGIGVLNRTSYYGQPKGNYEFFVVGTRLDEADGREFNRMTYSYGSKNFATIPMYSNPYFGSVEYTTQTYSSSGESVIYSFNMGNDLLKEEHFLEGSPYKVIDYEGGAIRPSEIKTTYRDSRTLNSVSSIENYQYNQYGEITNYWSPLAEGTKSYEYETQIYYDPSYHMPVVKTYKKDKNTTIREDYILTADKKSVARKSISENGVLKSQTDYSYDRLGNITETMVYSSTTDYAGTKMTYDPTGRLLLQKSSEGINEYFSYDGMARVLTYTNPLGGITRYEYDRMGRITKTTNPDGTYSTNTYKVSASENYIINVDENGIANVYYYDKLGNILSAYRAGVLQSAYGYDSQMRIVSETNAVGVNTQYAYDSIDRLTKKTISGQPIYEENYVYRFADGDSAEVIFKIIVGDANAPSIRSDQCFDKYGRLYRESTDYLNYTKYEYDYLGNKIKDLTPKDAAAGLSSSNLYEYDYAGKIVKHTNTEGAVTLTGYDLAGRKISVTDPKGFTSTIEYDKLNRVSKESTPFSGAYHMVKTYAYDSNNNVTSTAVTNNLPGAATTTSRTDYEYNNRNFLAKVISYNNNAPESFVSYAYDNLGNKTEMQTANGAQVTKYSYDAFNRLVTLTDPLGQQETYGYDNNGNLISKTDRNGSVITNTYNAYSKLTEVKAIKGGTAAPEFMRYTYAKNGAMLTEENENLKSTYSYDQMGRVIKAIESNGIEKAYKYDLSNNRTEFTLTLNGIKKMNTTYSYDKMNRLERVFDNGEQSVVYSYDQNGNRQLMSYANGVTTSYAYNSANMITSLKNQKGTSVLSSYQYDYFLDGNMAVKTDDTNRVTRYTYDGLGRLMVENETALTGSMMKEYNYDKAGNRSQMKVSGSESYVTAYEYDLNNRLLKEIKTVGGTTETGSYTYDKNGNQISKLTSAVSQSTGVASLGIYLVGEPAADTGGNAPKYELNEFDVFNRFTKTEQNGVIAAYKYKQDGLRLSKTVNGAKTTHVWDDSNMVMELDASGAVSDRYVRGINLIKSDKNGYYLFNAHGDVTGLTDTNGLKTKDYHYDAFGVEVNQDKNDANAFRYCGEYFDLSSGIDTSDFTGLYNSDKCYVTKPGSSETVEAIVLASAEPYAIAHTQGINLSTNTVYVLEFEYWADTEGRSFFAGLYPDDLPSRFWLEPKRTVQKAKIEISSANLNMADANLRFVAYAEQGNVYVANVRFYNKETVESVKYLDIGYAVKTESFTALNRAEKREVICPYNGKPVMGLVLTHEDPYAEASTPKMNLKTNTVYVLEFEYWADTEGRSFFAGLYPDDLPSRFWLEPKRTVQKAKIEISSANPNMANAYLRFVAYVGSGNVYVANVLFYEKNSLGKAPEDTNPFRYCGEYTDLETNTIYLRNRYYTPATGRFSAEDNVHARRMNIFDPFGYYQDKTLSGGVYRNSVDISKFILTPFSTQINDRESKKEIIDTIVSYMTDKTLGLTYVVDDPLSLNLYTYCQNNPIFYTDPSGNSAIGIGAGVGSVGGPPGVLIGVAVGTVVTIIVAVGAVYMAEEHTKGARPSTKGKHEKGQARKQTDKGGEKGDAKRKPRKDPRK